MAKTNKSKSQKVNPLVKTPLLKKYVYVGVNAGNRLSLGRITVTFSKITDKRLEDIFKLDSRWNKYFQPIKENPPVT